MVTNTATVAHDAYAAETTQMVHTIITQIITKRQLT